MDTAQVRRAVTGVALSATALLATAGIAHATPTKPAPPAVTAHPTILANADRPDSMKNPKCVNGFLVVLVGDWMIFYRQCGQVYGNKLDVSDAWYQVQAGQTAEICGHEQFEIRTTVGPEVHYVRDGKSGCSMPYIDGGKPIEGTIPMNRTLPKRAKAGEWIIRWINNPGTPTVPTISGYVR